MSATSVPKIPGPPYPPQAAQPGGLPDIKVDDPICAVFILLFALAAGTHLTILRLSRKRHLPILIAFLTFVFCMARIVALAMRLAWASHLTNVNIAIAANVFAMAGVLLLYVINLIFVRRFLRSYAIFGRHLFLELVYRFLIFCIVACLIMVVTVTVYSFFTLDQNVRRICRDVQLVAVTYIAALAFIPIPAALLGVGLRRKTGPKTARLFVPRAQLLLFTATLLSLGAGFRCGVAYDVRPINQPAWFHHKASYYCFNFAIEVLVVGAFVFARLDRRFRDSEVEKGATDARRLNTEIEIFGQSGGDEEIPSNGNQAKKWDKSAERELAETHQPEVV